MRSMSSQGRRRCVRRRRRGFRACAQSATTGRCVTGAIWFATRMLVTRALGVRRRAMTRCLPPRAGTGWPLTLPFIPYMRANLRQKQHDLAGADAIVAVSGRVAAYLRERAPDLTNARIEAIPNGVDVAGMRAHVRASTPPLDRPVRTLHRQACAQQRCHDAC